MHPGVLTNEKIQILAKLSLIKRKLLLKSDANATVTIVHEFQYCKYRVSSNGVTSKFKLDAKLTALPTGPWISSADGRNRLYFTANATYSMK